MFADGRIGKFSFLLKRKIERPVFPPSTQCGHTRFPKRTILHNVVHVGLTKLHLRPIPSIADEDLDSDWEEIKTVLSEAVDGFIAMRAAEGERLCTDVMKKAETIKASAAKIKELSENDIKSYPAKLEQRIKQLLSDFDVETTEQRILTEAAIFADKAAIDEELVRLDSHFKALDEIVHSDETAGRKLDFLVQEINREINTIGSKAGNSEIAHLVVEMKTELEKIREQIQNIE